MLTHLAQRIGIILRAPLLLAPLLLVACSGGGGGSGEADATAPAAAPPASSTPAATTALLSGSVSRSVEVPGALAQAPFNSLRTLNIPSGFGIRLFARVPNARFMALAPNGDILVSDPEAGKISLLRERAGNVPEVFDFATGLNTPHDMVFHQIDGVTYLYIAETNQISRTVYSSGSTSIGARSVVVANLPSEADPGLRGTYSHKLKNIALGADNMLYVSIASTCNACTSDTTSTPQRGTIYQYNADGSGARLFAKGLRNAEGLDFLPGTNNLWVTVNSRDQLPYPFDRDADGDGSNDYGKVLPAFVNDNPPDLFTKVRDGGNYGWPYCNPLPNASMSDLTLAPDYDHNRSSGQLDCATADKSSKGLRAHSAPLGMSFLQDTNAPPSLRQGAVVASHGCWNCTRLDAGYKVSFFPFDSAGNPGAEVDLITGFVINPDTRSIWGRPVDAIADAKGNILVSDDMSGAIYQLYPTGG